MKQRGRTIARLLAGSWRASTAPLPSARELDDCVSLVVDGGAGALAWLRVRGTALEHSSSAVRLRDAHRVEALAAAMQRRQLTRGLDALSLIGVTALCAKGWSVARHYRDPRSRAAGDIDIYVAPADYRRAVSTLADVDGEFDVHGGLRPLADRDFDAAGARAQHVVVDNRVARVLSPADHVRLVCMHMLGHGAWRPLWLCDVGALVEAGGIDWDVCLAGKPHHARWVACAVVAARELLCADISSAPSSIRETRLPSWFEPALLNAWGERHRHREPIASYRSRLAALPSELWRRWPNPIEATVDVGADFDEAPRLPLQLSGCALRVGRFAHSLATRHRLERVDAESRV